MKRTSVKRLASIILLLLLSGAQLAYATDKDARELLQCDFDGELDSGFAAVALNDPHISLAEGAGQDGSNAIRVSYVGSERGSERVTFRYPLLAAVTEATLSFDVCFEEDFQWRNGGKLHGLGPLYPVTGGKERLPDRWSARIMFEDEGRVSSYLYDQNIHHRWGVSNQTSEPILKAGKWHHVVLQVILNDPNQANGGVRILIDGKTAIKTTGMIFRGTEGAETMIQTLMFNTFHGGHSAGWTPLDSKGKPTTVQALFDNFRVTEGIRE